MKINAKTIIIILIVCVVAYLFYKEKRYAADDSIAGGSSSTSAGTDINSLESVISASGMTAADAAEVRRYARSVEASTVRSESVREKAAKRGYTFAQMLALDGFWNIYQTTVDGTSVFKDKYSKDDASKNYYWRVVKTIQNLY